MSHPTADGDGALPEDPRPTCTVTRGNPSDEELAAVVALLTAAAAGGSPEPPDDSGSGSAWSSHARRVGQAPHPGPGAWRASALPG